MHPDQVMHSAQRVYYTTATLTHLLHALHMSHANLNKMASLLRDHTLDMISQTVHRLASALCSASTKNWTPSKCARYILTHLAPEPVKPKPPPTRRPVRCRTTTRLVPSDDATAEAIVSKGGHPYVEVVLRDSKLVWDVVTHLFAKWRLPIVVSINGQPACIRARLAAFLPEPSSDKPVVDAFVLNATYQLSAPAIPPIVFKAARGCLLLPDAPPSPPPLPPLPSSPPTLPRTHNPRTKRTYATPPPHRAIANHNFASQTRPSSPSVSREASLSGPTSAHSFSAQSIQASEFLTTISKSPAPPPISSLPEIKPPSSTGQESNLTTNKMRSEIPSVKNSACVPPLEGASTSKACDKAVAHLSDDVSTSEKNVKHDVRTQSVAATRKTRKRLPTLDINPGKAAKRRRVFVLDGTEWLERFDPNDPAPAVQNVGLSGLASTTEPLLNFATVQEIQDAIDRQVTEVRASDFEIDSEIPRDFMEKSNLAMSSLRNAHADLTEMVFSLEKPNGHADIDDSGNRVAPEKTTVEDGTSLVRLLDSGGVHEGKTPNTAAGDGGKINISKAAEFERLLMGETVGKLEIGRDDEGLFASDNEGIERLLSSDGIDFSPSDGITNERIHFVQDGEQVGSEDAFDPAELNALLDL